MLPKEKEACMSPFVGHLSDWIGLICVVCSKQEERLAGEKALEEQERLQHSEGKAEENRIQLACGSNFTRRVLKKLIVFRFIQEQESHIWHTVPVSRLGSHWPFVLFCSQQHIHTWRRARWCLNSVVFFFRLSAKAGRLEKCIAMHHNSCGIDIVFFNLFYIQFKKKKCIGMYMQCSGVPETFAISYAAKRCGKSRQPFGCVHAISFIKFNLNSFMHDLNLLGLICFGSVRYFRYFFKGLRFV